MGFGRATGMTKASRGSAVEVDPLADRAHDHEEAIAPADNGLDVARPQGFIVELRAERPNMAGDEVVAQFGLDGTLHVTGGAEFGEVEIAGWFTP